jgi:parallel beta-helix repeat protein
MSDESQKNGLFGSGLRLLWAAPVVSMAIMLSATATPALAASCSRVASLSGSDSGPGTGAQPYRTVQQLADSLQPGETGCLRGGTYSDNVSVSNSGEQGAPLTITSYPGERATIEGKLWIKDSANFITISSLNLNGRNAARLPSPAVNGDDVSFVDDDVTNDHTAICFDLGPTTYGRAYRPVIERSRIHDCGVVPNTNLQHGIYVEHTTDARIVNNTIYDNADRGVQLYPDAQHSYVARNVIDGTGEGVLIAGGAEEFGPQASSDNVIEQNVITNSNQRNNVESFWGTSLVGQRNVVRNNCIYGGARDASNHGLAPDKGFNATNNVMADPLYVNRAAKDFRLASNSPCQDLANASVKRAGSATQSGIELSTSRTSLRPGGQVVLTGKVAGATSGSVTISVRRGKRWQRVKSIRVRRSGHFAGKSRLRRAGAGAHSSRRAADRRLVLQGVGLSGVTRTLQLRASASGVGHSRTVKVRILR